MEKYISLIKAANTRLEILEIIISALTDKCLNKVGCAFYNGEAETLGECAKDRIAEIDA